MNRLIATYKGHYKALFYLGLPIVIGQMGVIVLGFADTLMVGHHSTAEFKGEETMRVKVWSV